MGSTFVEFQGRGFEASDATLEIWLLLLVDEINTLSTLPEWLYEAREEWRLQATAGFGFGVVPGLDSVVTTPQRRDVILDLCAKSMDRLRSYGPVILKDELNAFNGGGEGSYFTGDVASKLFEQTADYFMKLLRGELKPSESDARFPTPE